MAIYTIQGYYLFTGTLNEVLDLKEARKVGKIARLVREAEQSDNAEDWVKLIERAFSDTRLSGFQELEEGQRDLLILGLGIKRQTLSPIFSRSRNRKDHHAPAKYIDRQGDFCTLSAISYCCWLGCRLD